MARDPHPSRWRCSPERAELLALYAEADALVAGRTCDCSANPPAPSSAVGRGAAANETDGRGAGPHHVRCCQFAVTGREPYPTAVELEEVRHAMRGAGIEARSPRDPRKLPLAAELRPCPLLSESGRCRIYASRPLGCRTFFCQTAEAPYGARVRNPRDEANAIGRRIADLSARFAPRDPHPRALTKSLA